MCSSAAEYCASKVIRLTVCWLWITDKITIGSWGVYIGDDTGYLVRRVWMAGYTFKCLHLTLFAVWSIAEHGPTALMVQNLRPLLMQYGVSA